MEMEIAKDFELLEYAIQNKRTMVSLDHHFPNFHKEYLLVGQEHCGIISVSHDLQGDGGIGTIIKSLLEFHELVEAKVAVVEEDIYNQIYYVTAH